MPELSIRSALVPLVFVAAAALMLPVPAAAMFVDVQYLGGVDIAAFETWSWGEGSALPNQEVERAVRAVIEGSMASKGYVKVDKDADCYVSIHAKADEWFDGGLLKIEAVDGATGKTVWRGKAEGAVEVKSIGKRKSLAQRTVKKMFKKFPERR